MLPGCGSVSGEALRADWTPCQPKKSCRHDSHFSRNHDDGVMSSTRVVIFSAAFNDSSMPHCEVPEPSGSSSACLPLASCECEPSVQSSRCRLACGSSPLTCAGLGSCVPSVTDVHGRLPLAWPGAASTVSGCCGIAVGSSPSADASLPCTKSVEPH